MQLARRQQKEARKGPRERFWECFAAQAATLAELLEQEALDTDGVPCPMVAELHRRLRKINPQLEMMLVNDPDGPVGVISACGGLTNVPVVLQMVAAAPQMANWRIIPFGKGDDSDPLRWYYAPSLPIEDAGFTIVLTTAGLRLTIYTLLNPERVTCMRRYGETLIDKLFGRAIFQEFAEVVWRPAPRAFDEDQQVYALDELADVLTELKATMRRITAQPSTDSLYHASL